MTSTFLFSFTFEEVLFLLPLGLLFFPWMERNDEEGLDTFLLMANDLFLPFEHPFFLFFSF